MDRAKDLADLHELKARYFRFLDTKDWDRFRELFTDDMESTSDRGSVLPSDVQAQTIGGDAFVEHVSRLLLTAVTVHHGHMPEIAFTGDRSAVGVWAMFDWVDDPVQNRATRGFGHYHETYEKGGDDRWRIKRMRLTRIRIDEVDPSHPAGNRPWPGPWTRGSQSEAV